MTGTAPGLEGIRVIQTARILAGPMAGRLLADWGADVITVEPVIDARRGRAILPRQTETYQMASTQNLNRNKRSIALDLSREGGREILLKIAGKTDVLLSNFRPREIEKFRLDYETMSRLNPGLIYANITSYGKKGPDRDLPAYGLLAALRAGFGHLLDMPGADPVVMPRDLPDLLTGLCIAYGITLALLIRERSGLGQEVDTSLFHAMVWSVSSEIGNALAGGRNVPYQTPRKEVINPLTNFYRTKDGRWVRLSLTPSEPFWPGFCRALGREDIEHDPRFESNKSREKNHVALFHLLEKLFLSKSLDEWTVRLNDAKVLWAPVFNLQETIADPQARANDFFVPIDHPAHGRMEVVTNPVTLGKTPQTIKTPAPEPGQHTAEVLLEYGYTADEITRFREQKIIS